MEGVLLGQGTIPNNMLSISAPGIPLELVGNFHLRWRAWRGCPGQTLSGGTGEEGEVWWEVSQDCHSGTKSR